LRRITSEARGYRPTAGKAWGVMSKDISEIPWDLTKVLLWMIKTEPSLTLLNMWNRETLLNAQAILSWHISRIDEALSRRNPSAPNDGTQSGKSSPTSSSGSKGKSSSTTTRPKKSASRKSLEIKYRNVSRVKMRKGSSGGVEAKTQNSSEWRSLSEIPESELENWLTSRGLTLAKP
jgi:hypothetical protein